jgi:hypothetical protein
MNKRENWKGKESTYIHLPTCYIKSNKIWADTVIKYLFKIYSQELYLLNFNSVRKCNRIKVQAYVLTCSSIFTINELTLLKHWYLSTKLNSVTAGDNNPHTFSLRVYLESPFFCTHHICHSWPSLLHDSCL